MRDAFGGEFMMRLLLIFIVIYVGFTAVSLNYAKAFRVKNKVISYIEEKDIQNLENINCKDLGRVIKSSQYHKECIPGREIQKANGKVVQYCCSGVVIEDKEKIGNKKKYEVNTYADFNLGIFNKILMFDTKNKDRKEESVKGMFKITGEAYVRENIKE